MGVKLSVAVPIHDMENGDFFLERLQNSLEEQTFTDFEVVITKEGKMAENTNAAIKKSKGEIIKVLYMDDYLAHPRALEHIVDAFQGGWLVTGCEHDDGKHRFNQHLPEWNDKIREGVNTIGSPSVLAFENDEPLLFDERLSWLLDCELYGRLYTRYGMPIFLNDINVVIGIGQHQMTYRLTDEEKQAEYSII